MIFLLRIFHFHQHDFSSEASDLYDQHDHGHGVVHSRSLFGVAIGLGVHTVTEGIALGTSMQMGPPHEDEVALAGLGVFFAILLHKPLDAYSIVGMMKSAGHSQRARTVANVGFALLCPLVALASFWGSGIAWPGTRGGGRLCAGLCGGRVPVHCLERPAAGDPFPQPTIAASSSHPCSWASVSPTHCITLNPAPSTDMGWRRTKGISPAGYIATLLPLLHRLNFLQAQQQRVPRTLTAQLLRRPTVRDRIHRFLQLADEAVLARQGWRAGPRRPWSTIAAAGPKRSCT